MNKADKKIIEEKIIEFLDENKLFWGDEEFEEKLTEVTGYKCRCYDSGIDDGIDDDEDEYLMYSSFDFQGLNLILRVYYGNVTDIIGYYEIS